MKTTHKILMLLCFMLFTSCLVDEFKDKSYHSKHLIDIYYDSTEAVIRADETMIEISFLPLCPPAKKYCSPEYCRVAKEEQSQTQSEMFFECAERNNDYYEWQVPYKLWGNNSLYCAYANTALVRGVKAIELTSDRDYDAEHPAGESLMDIMDMLIDSFGEYVGVNLAGVNTASNHFGDTHKKYNEFTQKELSVIGPIINLSYGNLPTLSKKHNFTLTITFDDGEVFTDTVEVNF